MSSRVPYRNRWIEVREDRVVRPDGNAGLYGVVELRPSVAVLALNDKEEVALVGQWRYPTQKYSWELPRGGANPGETEMLEVARRELREETCVEAARWRALGALDLCNGVMRSVEYLFHASELSTAVCNPDPEEKIEVSWVTISQALDMVTQNQIVEATSVALLLRVALGR